MFSKVIILCAALVAANATALLHGGVALAHTGKSVSSRHQDAFGNYAFGYDIADGGASIKSRQEVGDAHGNKQGSYSSQINHIAPAAVPVAHAAPIAYASPVAVAHRAPIAVAHSAPVAVAHAAPVAYSTSSAINHVAAAPVYGAHVAHAAPLAVAHGAPVAYSTSAALNHVAAVPVARHVGAAPYLAGHRLAYSNGIVGHGLAYSNGIVGHGLVAPHLGGIAYGGLRSVHY